MGANVTENKAEIERLKDRISNLEDKLAVLARELGVSLSVGGPQPEPKISNPQVIYDQQSSREASD